MPSLSELADVVIGVDTHVETHTAAIVDAGTGAVIDEKTVPTTRAGYRDLVAWADQQSPARVWAIEGTGGHGAGLARHLAATSEVVVELDRPERAARGHGAKSDALDAVRAAREALARPALGTPRSTGDRQALSVLLATRRSAVDAATVAQHQLFSLVIAAPEVLREKFRDATSTTRVKVAARLRVHPAWDTGTATTARSLRALARRAQALTPRSRHPREGHQDHCESLAGRPARPVRRRPHHRRHRPVRLVPPRPHPRRSRLRHARRDRAHPRQQRPGHHPLPPQPARRPTAQPSHPHHRDQPATLRPDHPGLHRPTHHRRQDPTRDPTLPQALHHPRPLPTPRISTPTRLTNHRSVVRGRPQSPAQGRADRE